VDPLQKKYPNESNYAFVSNNPILYTDKDGKDKVITITILNNDGTKTQIQKVDKGYFHYGHDVDNSALGVFYKQDYFQNLTIDNSKGGNITVDEAMKNPNFINNTGEYRNMQVISPTDYIVDVMKGQNSEKDDIKYGYVIFGNGKDAQWNEGLPRAAEGSETLELGDWLDLIDGTREQANFSDLLKAGKLKDLIVKVENVTEAAEKSAEAAKRIKDEIAKNHSEKKNKTDTPDSAICKTCKNRSDSAHIDEINGKGTFQKLKKEHKTTNTSNGN
jgi:hypothetical protein